ncbi:MAG: sensor histidine kinase [Kouleothrix sp.]|nr:sensor histidine kinase [Kouleothrix sp.]
MEDSLPLAAAYQRLLGELSRRLGADHAELLLHADSPAPAPAAVRAGADGADEAGWRWLDIPINEGAREVGRLRMAFAAAAPLPGPADRAMAQALVDLAPLLAQERQQVALTPLREAGRRILAVTEEELQRIILDIHDGPVQKLFVVSSQLALLQSQIADSPELQRREIEAAIGRAAELVQSALQEIKNTLSTFRPAEFQRRPLESVLQGLAFQHEYATGNQVDLYIAGPIPPVSMPVKIALYRVLQEALSNSYRHAGVDSQEVFLTSQDRWVILEVTDEGIGFTPPPMEGPGATEREEHIGLRGMRERVHLAGGSLRVISQPGHGTRVIVQVPSDA